MSVAIRPWSVEDRRILTVSNRPEMMTELGGPETDAKLDERHQRYLDFWVQGKGWMFAIVTPEHPEGVGAMGYWLTDDGELEAGWNVHSEFQGRGYAVDALKLLLAYAAAHSERRYVRAIPGHTNIASNRVSEKAGFTFVRTFDGEYPPGVPRVENEWEFDLGSIR